MSTPSYRSLADRGKHLMISISGIRGVIPEGLDAENALHFARAFGVVTGKRILLGRDSRATGPWLSHLVSGALMAQGKEVLDAGLAPTPTIKAAVVQQKGDGGVIVSASHNPPEWNGLKFVQKGGAFFDRAAFERWQAAIENDAPRDIDWRRTGKIRPVDAVGDHIRAVLRALPNLEQIREQRYRVVVDAAGGAGRFALPALLEELGCSVQRLYCDATRDGGFPRPPEPTPVALKEFARLVRDSDAAIGFALDPDADRLVLGSPEQGAVNEEYSLPVAFLGLIGLEAPGERSRLRRKRYAVVNLSTSTLLDAVAAPYGVLVERAAVGEANVVAGMRKRRAIYGGEGNGGVIDPRIPSYGRDSLAGAALSLSAMAARGCRSLDQLLAMMPPLFMEKTKMAAPPSELPAMLAALESRFAGAQIDRRDGLRLSLGASDWVHVRGSNTEPIIRLIAQGASARNLEQLLSRAREALRRNGAG